MNVEWSEEARERVDQILDYLASESPNAAERWLTHLLELISSLGQFPESGRRLEQLPEGDTRQVVMRNYRIVSRVRDSVQILTIRHVRQLPFIDDDEAAPEDGIGELDWGPPVGREVW